MKAQEIRTLFSQMCDFIRQEHGIDLPVSLVIDYNGSYPKPRDFAKTNSQCIFLSPKILKAPRHRVEGLLRHELGHVLLMRQGDYDHSEQTADDIAELCFGEKILYDQDGVQSTKVGVYPRPLHLPQY